MPKKRGGRKKKTGEIYKKFPELGKGQFVGLVERNNGTRWTVIQIYPEKDEEKKYSALFRPKWPRIVKGSYVLVEIASSETHGFDTGPIILGIFDNSGIADMRRKGVFGSEEEEHNGIIFESVDKLMEEEEMNIGELDIDEI